MRFVFTHQAHMAYDSWLFIILDFLGLNLMLLETWASRTLNHNYKDLYNICDLIFFFAQRWKADQRIVGYRPSDASRVCYLQEQLRTSNKIQNKIGLFTNEGTNKVRNSYSENWIQVFEAFFQLQKINSCMTDLHTHLNPYFDIRSVPAKK